jgi:uncharacterized protein (DUF1697 family)
MAVHIALLRAVNVGGRSLPMAGLRELLAELDLEEPSTLLQSGNAVFRSGGKPATLEAAIAKGIVSRFRMESDVFVRTAREWDAVLAANPFPREAERDPAHLIVATMSGAPSVERVEALRAAIKGPERVAVVGRQAYIVYPAGMGTSKLTHAVVEARLGVRSTARNWNTARKLAALAGEIGAR